MKAQTCYKETDGEECAHCWKLRKAAPHLAEALHGILIDCESLEPGMVSLEGIADRARAALIAAGYTEEA